MRKTLALLLIAVAFNSFPSLLLAQSATPSSSSPSPRADQDERVVVSSNEVALDAVVKDKKGRPVTNLSEDDFEVYEDGVRQQLKSMRLIKREAGNRAATPATGSED
ncbi:MAG: hypothetical protein WKF84_08855 [Pyrinomonadaceae bacterium]